jgi:hypothetical protein
MIVLPFKFDQMGFEIIANAKKDSSQFFEYLLCKGFSSLFCNKDQNTSGDWDVSFSCEANVKPKIAKQESVGIDVGIKDALLCYMWI